MKNEIIKRLKSPVVWLSVIAQLIVIVNLFNPDIAEPIRVVTTTIVEVLTLFGVLNNPSDNENF